MFCMEVVCPFFERMGWNGTDEVASLSEIPRKAQIIPSIET